MIKLYGFSRVHSMARGNTRDLRALWALEEIGLPYEIVGMDHPAHDREDFRALAPFGQLPVLEDDGVIVTESGAIVLYLARKSGALMPRDLAGEAQVLRWSLAALNSIEPPLLSRWFVGLHGGKGGAPHEALGGWLAQRLAQLDGWLAARTYVATDEFTVADLLMTHVLSTGMTEPSLLEPHGHLRAYLARCTERPAWKRTLDAYFERVEAA